MATGRSNQLTKQIGEYLVASELARRGLLVATFSGNVPDFDIIATNLKGSSCPIQVKTIKGGAWQFSIDKFAEISFDGKKQLIGKKKPFFIRDLICVFVIASENYGDDQFFIIEWVKVQKIIITNHKRWLRSHGGIRPRKPDSLHCAINEHELKPFRNNWSLIMKRF
jgi:hypothetical protein